MKQWDAITHSTCLSTLLLSPTPFLFHEWPKVHRGLPRLEAKHRAPAGRARSRRHRRKTLARLRAKIPADPRRERLHHRTFRRSPNAPRRALCLSRRLADRPLGTTPLTDALQRAVAGGLPPRPGLASLASAGGGLVSVPRLERIFTADNLCRRGDLTACAATYDGHRHSIYGASGPNDDRSAGRRLAHQPF